ncbi:MAG: aldehyde ferredoxin oxidoreductase family protein [Chloroflexota bacterium]
MVIPYKTSIARIDLNREKSEIVEVDSSVLRKYIGGAGLAARILWDETSPTTDPFSPENRLMFMVGPLTGKVPLSSRAIICALSPANNAWGEATMGGSWPAEFSNTGLSGIVVSGRAKKPVYIYINNQEVRIEDARHLWGKDTFETSDRLQEATDKKAIVAAIGRAGERLVRMAGIFADGRYARPAARCGLGAVMGSKNLKAVVVRGTKKPKIIDETGLKAISKEVLLHLAGIRESRSAPASAAVTALIAAHSSQLHGITSNKFGSLGVRNQSIGRWDAFNQKYRESLEHGKHYYCRLCPTSCIESHVIEKDGWETRQQVLEMLMPAGSNCLIDDFDALQEGYELLNRYGIDTISFGYTLSFAMELFEKGIITKKDTGGIDLTWGNAQAMLEMVRQIGENEGFGKILGQGVKRAAEQIGGDAAKYALHVKGLEITHHDPRIYNSLALGYATGNKGASHYESPGHIVERGRPGEKYTVDFMELGYPQGVSRPGWENKADITKKMQDRICLINSLSVCQFAYQSYGVKIAHFLGWLNCITGWDMEHDEFIQAGERIFNLKRLINFRQGLTGKDDTLPPKLLEKLPDLRDDEQNVPVALEEHLQEYYGLRGWDKDGAPTHQKLNELGLL